MKPVCKAVSSDAETFANRSGMVAHGEARVEHGFGQRCYAGMAPLSPSDSATSEYLLVLSHFLDENLNERVIASVGAEYTGSHLLDKNVSYTN
jgi:hypothetical protein